uniref:Uncharacterized protein n=1 Tax=Romanomermis culicivorax TaxID=13658 RepID=A0A915IWB3_ROMCU
MTTNSSHASSHSSKVLFAMWALPMSSATPMANPSDAPGYSQQTSTTNMVMPSKEVTTAAP